MPAAGLKFDDLMIEEDPDVAEAIRRLTPEQQLARKRRQFRAFDISLKKTPLPDHIQAVQDPFEVRCGLAAVPAVAAAAAAAAVLLLLRLLFAWVLHAGGADCACSFLLCAVVVVVAAAAAVAGSTVFCGVPRCFGGSSVYVFVTCTVGTCPYSRAFNVVQCASLSRTPRASPPNIQ